MIGIQPTSISVVAHMDELETFRPCVIMPVYNHAATAIEVARRARGHSPVIVVDDGSTDGLGEELEKEKEKEKERGEGLMVLLLGRNQGKGIALRAGFNAARERGFTHVVTIDADGQHDPAQIPEFFAAMRERPDAIFLGARDLVAEGAPRARRWPNEFSNFWFRVQTGLRLPDTQCGFRGYPLDRVAALPTRCHRYDFELELLVLAAWAGVPIIPLAVRADYARETSRRSHYRPIVDFLRISALNTRLTSRAITRKILG